MGVVIFTNVNSCKDNFEPIFASMTEHVSGSDPDLALLRRTMR